MIFFDRHANRSAQTAGGRPHVALLAWLLCVLAAPAAAAHGVVSAQTQRLKMLLETDEDNVALRAQYAAALTDSQQFDLARQQLATIRRLGADRIAVDWLAARNAFEAADYADAVASLDRHVRKNPRDGRALELRGRALTKIGQHGSAAHSFAAALRNGRQSPDIYLYLAAAHAAAGDTQAAIRGLQQGLSRLGHLPVLFTRQAQLHASRGEFVAAADVMAALIAGLGDNLRGESYIALRGDYLRAAGDTAGARAAWRQAMTDLKSRSERIRRTPAALRLQAKLAARLARHDATVN